MHKDRVNYWVDALMAISFIIVGLSGILKVWIIPWSSPIQNFLGISKSLWADLHDWSGVVLVAMVFLHLVLHYHWIITETKALFSRKG